MPEITISCAWPECENSPAFMIYGKPICFTHWWEPHSTKVKRLEIQDHKNQCIRCGIHKDKDASEWKPTPESPDFQRMLCEPCYAYEYPPSSPLRNVPMSATEKKLNQKRIVW